MNRFPLYELHDIQPGPSLSTELTAPLLVVAGLLLLGLLCAWQLRRHARRKPVRRARRELAALSGSQPDLALRLNTWLKSTALHYWPRDRIAPLHGAEWLAFLDRSGDAGFSRFAPRWELWLYAGLRPSPEEATALLQTCRRWLRQLERIKAC